MKLTEVSIHHKITVFTGLLMLILLGVQSYIKLPRESAPDIPIPIILVSTLYPGVAPEDMEKLVTIPLEKKLKELSGVKELASTSAESFSLVRIEFQPEVDLDQAFQKVRDKVDLAKPDIPDDAEEPVLTEVNVSEFPILVLTLTGGTSLTQLEHIADDLKDKIDTIQGVLDSDVSGGLTREIQIEVNPEKLKLFQISINDVIQSIQTENVTIPGGTVNIGPMKFMVRIPGEVKEIHELSNIIVKNPKGKPVFLRDLAKVIDGYEERESYARFNGIPSIALTVRKRAGENTIRIVDEVKSLLELEKNKVSKNIHFHLTFDESEDVKMMVNDLENSILSGIFLIVVVLLFFMGFRNSFFVALAIPFSMLLSFVILDVFGFTLNMVVLFSLILAVGMLVDNAVVIVENIYRHGEEGYSLGEAAFLGTSEVSWPIIASSATTIAAFFPMIFWPDIIGEFMSYLPKTVIIVLVSSVFIAFVANPVFCAVFMKIIKAKNGNTQAHQQGKLYSSYEKLLRLSLKHRLLTMIACFSLLIFIFILYGVKGRGVEFFPDTDPRRVYIDVNYPEGTSLHVSNQTTKMIETVLEKKKEIKHVITTVGGQGDGEVNVGGASPNLSRILVEFYAFDERIRPSIDVIKELREEVKKLNIPGAEIEFEKEQDGPPQDAPVKIEISGDNFNTLGKLVEQVKRRIKNIPGLVDLSNDYEVGRPEFQIIVDREKASRYKLSTHSVAQTIRTAINGTVASTFRDGDEEYDIVVRLPEKSRSTFKDIQNLTITNHDDEVIPLSQISHINQEAGWGSISRIDSRRTVTITGNNSEGVNANELLLKVKEAVSDFPLPPGYLLSFSGQQEEQDKNQAFLFNAFILAVAAITFILVTEFNSITMPMVIMTSVLLSLVGVFTGLMVTQTPFGIIMTGIGVISLAGVVVNNAIVLIDYIRQLRDRGLSRIDAVIKGGTTRLRPVLLTAITTIAGLIPLTTGYGYDFRLLKWTTGSESSQWWGPMGVAVIFGLAFATLLTLVVVPVMYTLVDDLEIFLEKKLLKEPTKD